MLDRPKELEVGENIIKVGYYLHIYLKYLKYLFVFILNLIIKFRGQIQSEIQ